MIGIKTKKIMRKITAIASAALMSGVSIGAAAAQLDSLGSTFITAGEFDAYVVLGTGGASNVLGFAKDVAGAVVVGAAMAQQATTSTASSGSATLSRNLTTGELNNSYFALDSSLPTGAQTWVSETAGFSWLTNTTVQNETDDDVANATAILTMNSGALRLTDEGNYVLNNKGVVYNLTFNNRDNTPLAQMGNKPIGNNTQNIPFPDGNLYEVTNWTRVGTKVNVTLGDYTEISATTGTKYNVGTTGASFEIIAFTTSPQDQLWIKVYDDDGSILFDDYVGENEEVYSNNDFSLRLSDYHTPGNIVDATMEWTTSKLKLVSGEVNDQWPNWTMKIRATPAGVSSIAWEYKSTQFGYVTLTQGTSLELLDGFFNLEVDSLRINSTDKETATVNVRDANTDWEISFIDENDTTHFVDITMISDDFSSSTLDRQVNWLDNINWNIKCLTSGSNFNITNLGEDVTITVANNSPFHLNYTANLTGYTAWAEITASGNDCGNADFNMSLINFTTDAGNPLNNSLVYANDAMTGPGLWGQVTENSVNGTLTLTEPNSETVVIDFKEGDINRIDASGDLDIIEDSGDWVYTVDWGTYLSRESGSDVLIVYPEAPRVGSASIGRKGTKDFELNVGEYSEELDVELKSGAGSSVAVNKIDVGLSKLDSEISTGTLSKPVILMGGWSVNSLVQDLVDAGDVDTGDLSADRALVQLIDSAFNGESALVIAGWEGDDTRLAAQVVASQVLGVNMGLSGSKAILNTGVTSYSDVTVV